MFLGLNAFFHDSSACLVDKTGRIVAAVQEERFSRVKQEKRFPSASIEYCLRVAGASMQDLEGVAFAWDPWVLLRQRILWSNLIRYPVQFPYFLDNVKKFYEILSVTQRLIHEFGPLRRGVRLQYLMHHRCHAASAYFASPFDDAAFLTLDGFGELECTTWGEAHGADLRQLGRTYFPDSVGKVYSGIARYLGFTRAEKDGTVMALAACGRPKYLEEFRRILRIDRERGLNGITLDRTYFDLQGVALPSGHLEERLGVKRRQAHEPLTQAHADIAASLQTRTEEAVLFLANELHRLTRKENLVLAGGVALNSVINGLIVDRTPFKRLFIQPAANDAGLSLGAAYLLAYQGKRSKLPNCMNSAALGPSFDDSRVLRMLQKQESVAVETPNDLVEETAERLANGEIVAWFQGRLEFGPRALGNRSILADPRISGVQERLNRIKSRERFRPFAAAVMKERAVEVLSRVKDSPFMLLVDTLRAKWRGMLPGAQHVDGSVRVQTVTEQDHPLFYRLLAAFHRRTDVPLLINTSLNIRGEPLVRTPEEALAVFMKVPIDALVIGPFLVTKTSAPDPNGFAEREVCMGS